MAQRATGFSKKLEVVGPAFGSVSASDVIRAPAARRAIPLEFVTLLAPYKKHGKLSLRLERVPQLARLSAGRDNGDGSWTLVPGELDGLTYFLPKSVVKEHTLAIRILTTEDATETTLKVLDFPISPDTAGPDAKPEEAAASPGAAEPQNPAPQSELKNMLSIFAVREADLAAMKQEVERGKAQREADLAAARLAWNAELDERLSAAADQAAADLRHDRLAWQEEQDIRIAELEARAEKRIAEESERWERESRGALSKTEKRWKVEEAGRLAAAEAEWREKSSRALADAAERLERSQAALAEAQARIAASPPPSANKLELSRLRNELAAMKSALTDKNGELIDLQRNTEQALERGRLESETALLRAQTGWKAEEAVRFATAEANWREKFDRVQMEAMARCERLELALAETRAQIGAASKPGENELKLGGLRDELAAARAALAEREDDLVELRLVADRTNKDAEREAEASLRNAKRAWEADEAARFAAAEELWHQQSARALTDAVARYESAELALAKTRKEGVAALSRPDDAYVGRLRAEIATLQEVLTGREAELVHARSSIEQLRARYGPEGNIPQQGGAWAEGGPEEQSVRRANLRLVRDVVVVVSLVMSLILFFPRFVSFLPDEWRANIAAMTGEFGASAGDVSPSHHIAAPQAPKPAPVAKQQTAVVSRAVNVRVSPAVSGAVVSTLQRNSVVTIYERHGNWTHVGFVAEDGSQGPQQGWVYSSFLKDAGPGD